MNTIKQVLPFNSALYHKFTTFDFLKNFKAMKSIFTMLALMLCLTGLAQQPAMDFEASDVNLNLRGNNVKKTTEMPVTIHLDFEANTITIQSDVPEIKELFRNKTTLTIEKTMGELGEEFSLTVDQNIFAHFYLDDRKMIMFTRNDIHPTKWGLMLKGVKIVEGSVEDLPTPSP